MAGLGFDAWLTVAVVVAALALLLWERFSPDVVLLGSVVTLILGGVLSPVEALAGFSNSAVLTVAVLFVVAGSLRATGAIRWLGAWVLGRPRGAFRALARLTGVSAVLSAFVNNTPVVAMLTSAVENWSRRSGVSPSRLLLPLSYATILGGLCTLIGTSTNLVVDGLAQARPGLPTVRMFDPAWVGVPAAVAGLLYLWTLGRWLVPDRLGALAQAADTQQYVLEMCVDPGGPLVGRRIDEAGLRSLDGLYLVEIQRDGRIRPVPASDMLLEAADQLVFVGAVERLRELRQHPGLLHAERQVFKVGGGEGRHFVEAVLSRLSPVVGQSLRAARFRQRYGAVVVAVNRHGRQLRGRPGDVVLQAGDTLLLETTPSFTRDYAQSREFLMVNLLDDVPPVQPRRAVRALAILGAMVAANSLLDVDIFVSALVAALAMVGSRCLTLREARRAIDLPLVVVIACAFAIGRAIDKTGVAARVAELLMQGAGGDPFWTLVLVYAATVVFTELLSNNAAAVLMFPIAIAAATQLQAQPMPFMMAVMVGASAGFMTPIGYQTNLMVYGPGGYRFVDYLRVGAPLSLLVGTVVLWTIPRVWPL